MKKTLCALFAMAGAAFATTLEDAVATYQGESLTSTVTVENWTANKMSVAITLDVGAVKEMLTTTWIAGAGQVQTMLNMQGTWNSATEGRTDIVGVNFNGSSSSKYATPYLQATSPNGNSAAIKANGASESLKFNASTDWNDIAGMALVLTHDGSTTGALYCAVMHNDGTFDTFAGSNSGIKFSTSTAFAPNGTLTDINTNLVTSLNVFDSVVNQADSLAIAQELAVPEPATATLSLLSLAGLAARRRRH